MILYDFSSLLHRCLHTSIKHVKPHKQNGKFKTDEFIGVTIFRILNEIFEVNKVYSRDYGNIIICMDDHSKKYWRKEFYHEYKFSRVKIREESEIDYNEVFKHLNVLAQVLNDYTPWKCITSPGAEADDIIGVLTRKFVNFEKILILSPDKDFKQLHPLGDVKQWSNLTNNWVTVDDYELWKIEHIVLGDACDGICKITDNSKFSDEFKNSEMFKNFCLTNFNKILNEFEYLKIPFSDRFSFETKFNDKFPDLKVYDNPRFGPSTLQKKIKEFGTLDNFLDSNEIYRYQYERNKKLVLDSEIPVKIEVDIINQFNNSSTKFDLNKLEFYLNHYKLRNSIIEFQKLAHQKSEKVELTTDNCGW